MSKPESIRNIALFIDYENMPVGQNVDQLIDKIKESGRLIIRRAYGDWGRFQDDKRHMVENSVDIVEMPYYSGRGKNSSDIRMVIDALEMVYTKTHIDAFAIVSGDSDFIPLLSKLRENNKYVIIISGSPQNTSRILKNYCDELIYFNAILGSESEGESNLQRAYSLLSRSITLMEERGLRRRGSQIKFHMKQLDSSFDETNYGITQFKKFLQKAQEDGIITLEPLDGGDYEIRSDSQPVKQDTQEKESKTTQTQLDPELKSLVYWALAACLSPERQEVFLSTLKEAILTLDPEFDIRKYGGSNNMGFRGLIESSFVKKGLLHLNHDPDNHVVTAQMEEKFKSEMSSQNPPEGYHHIRMDYLFKDAGMAYSYTQARQFVQSYIRHAKRTGGIDREEIDAFTKELKSQITDTANHQRISIAAFDWLLQHCQESDAIELLPVEESRMYGMALFKPFLHIDKLEEKIRQVYERRYTKKYKKDAPDLNINFSKR